MKVLIAIVLSLTMISCASYQPPKEYHFDKSKIINKSYDEVWTKVIKWFAENNTPIKTMEKVSGFIATEYQLSTNSSTDCLDCGTKGFYQIFKSYTGNFNIHLEKISDTQTKITISTFFKANIETINAISGQKSSSQIDCNSTGVLEKSLLNSLSM